MTIEFEYLGLRDVPPTLVDYQWAWDHQREVHARVASGEIDGQVMLLEHEAVYTAGKQTLPEERPFDGTPVIDVDRGGKITWHGPGQLVGYPIMLLPDRVGVVDHVRRVEQAVIELLAQYGIQAGRVPGRTGVWLPADDPAYLPPIATGPHHAKSVERTGYFTPGDVTSTGSATGSPDPGVLTTAPGSTTAVPEPVEGTPVTGFQLASIAGQAPAVGFAADAEHSRRDPSLRGSSDAARSAGGSVTSSLQSRSMGVVPPHGIAELSGHDPSLRGSSDLVRSAGGGTGVVPPHGMLRPERKICAIGIRVTRRTTMHGFALNISNASAGFDNIVPCGIPDAGVTSMAAELGGSAPSVLEVAERLEPLLATHLSREGNLTR